MDTSNGTFLVSCKDVTPFLDGFKVKLDVGNPSSVTFKGIEINARWGANAIDVMFNDSTSGSVKRTGTRLETDLQPGVWNSVTLTVPSASAEELKNLTISAVTDRISMGRDYR